MQMPANKVKWTPKLICNILLMTRTYCGKGHGGITSMWPQLSDDPEVIDVPSWCMKIRQLNFRTLESYNSKTQFNANTSHEYPMSTGHLEL